MIGFVIGFLIGACTYTYGEKRNWGFGKTVLVAMGLSVVACVAQVVLQNIYK